MIQKILMKKKCKKQDVVLQIFDGSHLELNKLIKTQNWDSGLFQMISTFPSIIIIKKLGEYSL